MLLARVIIGGLGVVVLTFAGRLATTTATATAAAATAAVSRSLGGVTVCNVIVIGVRVVVIVVVSIAIGLISTRGRDGLGSDKQRHVRRRLPTGGFSTGGFNTGGFDTGGRNRAVAGLGGQHCTDPKSVGLVDTGLRAAGATVERGERIKNPLAGGAQCTSQRMDSQPVGKRLLIGCGRLPLQRVFGQFLGEIIIGH
jgi:hypothetical protein